MNKIFVSHLFDDCDLKKLIDEYDVGIEAIDFSIGFCLDDLNNSIKKYKNRMGNYIDNQPLGFHGPFLDMNPASFDPAVKDLTMKRFNLTYKAAQRLNGKYLVVHTCLIPSVYYEQPWLQNSIEFWNEFLSDKDDSIMIFIENMYDNNPEPIAKLIDEINRPCFKACLDIGHANCFSKRPIINGWFRELGDRIGHFHLHCNNGSRDQHLPLSYGDIPINDIVKIISEKYPDAGCTLEMNTYEDVKESIEIIKR